MRLFLLPISTRRTLIYCERAQQQQPTTPGLKPPLQERILNRAADTWAGWEKAEKGWQKQLTVQGNRLLRRIPYEEWGLKSFPPATRKRLRDVDEGRVEFECLYPGAFVKGGREGAEAVLRRLATERQAWHRRRLWWSVGLMPPTIPFALVPIIPNIPFFYLVFRAYSHYRALYGGKLLEHLVSPPSKLTIRPSPEMDALYTAGLLHASREASRSAPTPMAAEAEQAARMVEAQSRDDGEDVMMLQKWNGKLIAERFGLPEMEIEIERAVEQVEAAIERGRVETKEGKR